MSDFGWDTQLFNGDFVDRGSFSVECIFTLFGFKLLYPQHFFMARGNHESQTMNQMYGFEGEVKSKYSPHMAELFTEVQTSAILVSQRFTRRPLDGSGSHAHDLGS